MNEQGNTGLIILVLIVGIVVGVLSTIVFAKYVLYKQVAPFFSSTMEKIEKAGDVLKIIDEAITKDDLKTCEQISDAEEILLCQDSVYTERAKNGNSIAVCTDFVSDKRKDSCYNIVAKTNNNEDSCYKIVSIDLKQACLNEVLKDKAVEKNDITLCLQTTEQSQIYCIEQISSKQVNRSFCDQIPAENKQNCLDKVLINEATALQNIAICDEIKNSADQISCRKNYYTPNDTDNDGLNDVAEDYYKTDKNNPDTDGDSYLDGDEVQHGYNPLGAGKMGEPTK